MIMLMANSLALDDAVFQERCSKELWARHSVLYIADNSCMRIAFRQMLAASKSIRLHAALLACVGCIGCISIAYWGTHCPSLSRVYACWH